MDFLLGFSASIISTIIFAIFLFTILKPRIKLSDSIAFNEKESFYKFKFYNRSLFKAFDIKFELLSCKEYEATENTEGVNVRMKDIKLTNKEILFIPKFRKSKNQRYADNCVTIRVKDCDLKNLVSEANSYLEFRITLKHGFSNLGGTFTKKYRTSKCIVKGDFEFGNSFEIS